PWVTSSSQSLASQSAVSVSGSSFTYNVPGPGIVTFVGTGGPTNSAPTGLALSNSNLLEHLPPGTPVGTLSSTDPDSGSTFTYSLVSGTGGDDNASFSISGTTLLSAASFDYETKNSFSIRVRTADQYGLYYDQ